MWIKRDGLANHANVRSLQALGPLLDFKLHLLTFSDGAKAVRLDGGVVNENIFAATVLSNETKALRIVKPLHSTSCHLLFFFLNHPP